MTIFVELYELCQLIFFSFSAKDIFFEKNSLSIKKLLVELRSLKPRSGLRNQSIQHSRIIPCIYFMSKIPIVQTVHLLLFKQ